MSGPYTTLFLMESLDGKISTGEGDQRDVDKDFKNIDGIKNGVHQYYELDQKTDLYSLNSGKVMAKIGVNERSDEPTKMGISFVIIDNKPHLNKSGVRYLSKWVKKLFLVTTNNQHPAFNIKDELDNIEIVHFDESIDFAKLLNKLSAEYGIERLTIQSGATLNAEWVRNGLIDEVSIVIAPLLIGGKNTPTLIDGESIKSDEDLSKLKTLELVECNQLENSFIHLRYKVNNK